MLCIRKGAMKAWPQQTRHQTTLPPNSNHTTSLACASTTPPPVPRSRKKVYRILAVFHM